MVEGVPNFFFFQVRVLLGTPWTERGVTTRYLGKKMIEEGENEEEIRKRQREGSLPSQGRGG